MKLHIQEAWWSAWKTFGWAKSIWGIGIAQKEVEKAITNKEKMEITVGKDATVYLVSPVTIKNTAEKNKWVYKAKGVDLYVMPHNLLR
jgi:hypothetical protein